MDLPAPTIFRPLTRPTINKLGLPHKFSVIVGTVTVIVNMWVFRRVGYLLFFLAVEYVLLTALVEYDPNFARVLQLWWKTKFKTKLNTRKLWGGSYLVALPAGAPDNARDVPGAV